MLKLDNYRDTNNFIVHNHVIYDKSRYMDLGQDKEMNFDIQSYPSWYSNRPKISTVNISSDDKNYEILKI